MTYKIITFVKAEYEDKTLYDTMFGSAEQNRSYDGGIFYHINEDDRVRSTGVIDYEVVDEIKLPREMTAHEIRCWLKNKPEALTEQYDWFGEFIDLENRMARRRFANGLWAKADPDSVEV